MALLSKANLLGKRKSTVASRGGRAGREAVKQGVSAHRRTGFQEAWVHLPRSGEHRAVREAAGS